MTQRATGLNSALVFSVQRIAPQAERFMLLMAIFPNKTAL